MLSARLSGIPKSLLPAKRCGPKRHPHPTPKPKRGFSLQKAVTSNYTARKLDMVSSRRTTTSAWYCSFAARELLHCSPAVGDRVSFQRRTSPIGGSPRRAKSLHGSGQRRSTNANLALSGFPTSNTIEETTISHYQDNERGRLAKHRGQPVKCEQCGRLARRKARHQRDCSARCAMRARSERYRQQMAAGALQGSRHATHPKRQRFQ